MNDIEYFKKFLVDIESISVKWGFDEAQADPFHSQFCSSEFLARLEYLVTQQGQSSRPDKVDAFQASLSERKYFRRYWKALSK